MQTCRIRLYVSSALRHVLRGLCGAQTLWDTHWCVGGAATHWIGRVKMSVFNQTHKETNKQKHLEKTSQVSKLQKEICTFQYLCPVMRHWQSQSHCWPWWLCAPQNTGNPFPHSPRGGSFNSHVQMAVWRSSRKFDHVS